MRTSHETPLQKVHELRNAYLTKAVLIDGLSKEAKKQNAKLLLALKKAGEILGS